MIKNGPENVRMFPHQRVAARIHGLTEEEKTLKQTRRATGWIPTWRRDKDGDPQKKTIVPCINAWTARVRERRRNAGVERVERVRGRNSKI